MGSVFSARVEELGMNWGAAAVAAGMIAIGAGIVRLIRRKTK